MKPVWNRNQVAVAVAAAIGATSMASAPFVATAGKTPGKYLAGDFHNHTTCSDGSISMQKLVKKSTDKVDTPWGLDWFAQAGHGGNGNRNCTLVEDDSLATPAYPNRTGSTPFDVPTPLGTPQNNFAGTTSTGLPAENLASTNPANPSPSQYRGPITAWSQSIGKAAIKGNSSTATSQGSALSASSSAVPNMWRWQSVTEFQYPLMEYLSSLKNLPLYLGLESVVAGHEHSSMSIITGQMPSGFDDPARLPTSAGFTPLGNVSAFAQWTYCFDRADTDWSRGNASVGGTILNNWDCSVPGSLNSSDVSWNATAAKLIPSNPSPSTPPNGYGLGLGTKGHNKTLEALKWMVAYHPDASY
jgi:hypothetical protein